MKANLNTNKAKNGLFHYDCTNFLVDPSSGLFIEDYFHGLICLERKRSERTRRPFLLMLMDIGADRGKKEADESMQKALDAVESATRDTDFKGWYKNGRVIGVLFTEVGREGVRIIKRKMFKSLDANRAPGSPPPSGIKVSFHRFPENAGARSKRPFDSKLYPELEKKKRDPGQALKRAVDVAGSLFLIAFFSPFLFLIPILIKASSKGPVLFRQTRIGAFGKPFTFLKFRSMYADASDEIHHEYVKKLIKEEKAYAVEADNSEVVYKIKDDPRITPVGRFIRRTSLDELPQFLNVLRGEMSLVGPRPPIPYELEDYEPWHRRRVREAKPGITGLWQVVGRSRTTFNDMVRLDLKYIDSWSLWLDIKILFKTPWAMLTSRGAY